MVQGVISLTKSLAKDSMFGLNNVLFLNSYISYIHIHIILGSEIKFRELINILT